MPSSDRVIAHLKQEIENREIEIQAFRRSIEDYEHWQHTRMDQVFRDCTDFIGNGRR